MSRAICVADLYGLGGLVTSPGMLTLAGKIRALGKSFVVLGPYDQDAWPQAADDLNRQPAGTLLAAVGYSLGANNVVQIAAALGRKIDYIAGIQPSFWDSAPIGRASSRCRQMSAWRSMSTIRISPPRSASAMRAIPRRPDLPARSSLSATAICTPMPTTMPACTA